MNIIFHVGFPKTGSTTQQESLFSKHSQVLYLGKPYDSTINEKIELLISAESIVYDPLPLKINFQKLIRQGKLEGKKVAVLSDETVVSISKVRDKGVVAHRIKDLIGKGQVLFTIRNQFDLLKSSYINGGRLLMNVPGKYQYRSVTFDEWLDYSYNNLRVSHIGNFVFYNTIHYYSKIFGKENVQVLLFEEFINEKEKYIKKLADILQVDFNESIKIISQNHLNPRISQLQLDFEIAWGRWIPINVKPLSLWGQKIYRLFHGSKKDSMADVDLSKQWEDKLKKVFALGNQKLNEEWRLPLAEYDYPL